jgi:ABC-2 type transport system ATP-binding protein
MRQAVPRRTQEVCCNAAMSLQHEAGVKSPSASPSAARDLAGWGLGSPDRALLVLDRIVKQWPGIPPVLDHVDVRLEHGTALAISGRNGTGKTTLLRIAAGLISPEGGSVSLDGLDVDRDRAEFQRRVGFLSAGNSGLYGRLKTEHHLELAARLALLPRARRSELIRRARERFELDALARRRVDRMSMGQRQRLRLALAFLHEPDVVLLDEPTTSLDEEAIALVNSALEALTDRGGAAIVCVPSGSQPLPAITHSVGLEGGALKPA